MWESYLRMRWTEVVSDLVCVCVCAKWKINKTTYYIKYRQSSLPDEEEISNDNPMADALLTTDRERCFNPPEAD